MTESAEQESIRRSYIFGFVPIAGVVRNNFHRIFIFGILKGYKNRVIIEIEGKPCRVLRRYGKIQLLL